MRRPDGSIDDDARASARRSRCSCRSEAVSPATTTSTGRATSPTGPARTRTAGRTRSTTRIRSSSRARVFNGTENYCTRGLRSRPAADRGGRLRRHLQPDDGGELREPAAGGNFYPIYTTGKHGNDCVWHLGGPYLQGTTNTFGGNSTAEYGPLLLSIYPGNGFMPRVPVQQLPADPEQQPLSGLRKENDLIEGASSGAPLLLALRPLGRSATQRSLVEDPPAGRAHLALDLVRDPAALTQNVGRDRLVAMFFRRSHSCHCFQASEGVGCFCASHVRDERSIGLLARKS